MRWNCKEIIERVEREGFEKVWVESSRYIKKPEIYERYPLLKISKGKSHPVFDTMQKLREIFLKLGFEEVINPIFIEEKEIYKQFGPEAPAILDRCYYLATLPRPDIGIKKEDEIFLTKELSLKESDVKVLKEIFREYKKGKIFGDDLMKTIVERLNVSDDVAIKILEHFKEFKNLSPIPSRITLRSHMTSGWFLTLSKIIKEKPKPIKLFSIDRCFRREQREDETRIKSYFSASCVVADEDVTIEYGKALAEAILEELGFERIKFKPDEKRSKYYTPGTQTEVFVYSKDVGWIEVATFGIYNPIALSRYGIDIPVLNLGFGVERISMLLYGYRDIREIVYPQFYSKQRFSDREIASMLSFIEVPITIQGREIAEKIIEVSEKYKDEKAPCEFLVYKGKIFDKNVEVYIYEKEEGKKLLGPACFNKIYIYNGNIYGILEANESEIVQNGLDTGIRYIDGIAYKFARDLENAALRCEREYKFRVTIVRNLSDINLKLKEEALRYMMSNGKKLDVRGPVFINLKAIFS